MNNNDFGVKMSPLTQTISSGNKTVQVDIYGDGDGGWILEVIDESNNSTIWDEPFDTDLAALAEARKTLSEEAGALPGPKSGRGGWA